MSDTIEQHQEQPPAGERSPELADGCCPVAVAAPNETCAEAHRPLPRGDM
jgi:hypothetical protein